MCKTGQETGASFCAQVEEPPVVRIAIFKMVFVFTWLHYMTL